MIHPDRWGDATWTTDETVGRRVRARCVWWLSGQCKGGATCSCLPWPRESDAHPTEPPDEQGDD